MGIQIVLLLIGSMCIGVYGQMALKLRRQLVVRLDRSAAIFPEVSEPMCGRVSDAYLASLPSFRASAVCWPHALITGWLGLRAMTRILAWGCAEQRNLRCSPELSHLPTSGVVSHSLLAQF